MNTISRFTTIVTMLICGQLSFAQTAPSELKNGPAHFSEFPDSIIKQEVALFNIKGASTKKTDSSSQLLEIPIRFCKNKEIHLSKGSTYISVYFKEKTPTRNLDSIFLVLHDHYKVDFPGNAFKGISTNCMCNFTGANKQDKFFSPYFKAFHSKDNKRLYIYMQGGNGSDKYEVTWVIVNGKYYARIMDDVPNE